MNFHQYETTTHGWDKYMWNLIFSAKKETKIIFSHLVRLSSIISIFKM